MKVVDANVLLYAVDRGAEHHQVSKTWLDRALAGHEAVLLPWLSLLAFLRLSTHPAVHDQPLTVDQALDIVEVWVGAPAAITSEPDSAHTGRLRTLLGATGHGGNLVNDAHLAALAVQHRATVVTFDSDFGRFPGVQWERPSP
ncbi:MAG: TA system VapC family ribonuclease toxin [Ornithinimicrobium sp.]|uniref:TA system VapC family ribonuclease toxin n=1 Tax=Ornithinimicrobium sp. TaxID=1977084 RepID=UPI003D9B1B3C